MNRQEVITRQDGIFRVNCLDCLDRTNLIEQVICRSVLENILTNQGIYNNRMAFEGMIQNTIHYGLIMVMPYHKFIRGPMP